MRKSIKIGTAIGIVYPLVVGIIILFTRNLNSLQIVKPSYYSIPISCLSIFSALLVMILVIRLILRNRQNKSQNLSLLNLYLLFCALTLIQVSLFALISFNDMLFDNYWNGLTEFLIYPSFFYFSLFLLQTFYLRYTERVQKRYIGLIFVIFIFMQILSTLELFFNISQILLSSLIMIISLVLYTILGLNSHRLAKITQNPKERSVFRFMMFSGISYVIGFVFNLIYNIYLDQNVYLVYFAITSFILFLAGHILLFTGFSLKPREKIKKSGVIS